MRIVVDTNIVFSAILNTESKIARILLQPRTRLNFYPTHQLLSEIESHKKKILKLSGYSPAELEKIISIVTARIRFINVNLIPDSIYKKVEKLTMDVDIDDTEFVALAEHSKSKLWSGDKELVVGLTNKNWAKFISTNELYEHISKLK